MPKRTKLKKRNRKKVSARASKATPPRGPATYSASSNHNGETRAAEAVTVAWMMSALATFLAELSAIAAQVALWGGMEGERVRLITNVLLMIAMVTGALTLLLTPLAIRVRKIRPPGEVIFGAVVVGAVPIVVALIFRT